MRYQFVIDTYQTEIQKVLSMWAMFDDDDLTTRPNATDSRGRSVLEHMVHQSMSENLWFAMMLGIAVTDNPAPSEETRLAFMNTYAENGGEASRGASGKTRGVVGTGSRFLRGEALAGLGHDAAHRAYVAPPRPASRHAEDARPQPP